HLIVNLGLHDGAYLVEWLGDVLDDIGVTTFGDLALDDPGADANLRPEQRFSLVVHVSDITRGKCVRLPWDYPEYGLEPARQRIGRPRAPVRQRCFRRPNLAGRPDSHGTRTLNDRTGRWRDSVVWHQPELEPLRRRPDAADHEELAELGGLAGAYKGVQLLI